MGRNTSTNARGSYFFSTDRVFPYALGRNGTIYVHSDENVDNTSGAEKLIDEIISFQQSCERTMNISSDSMVQWFYYLNYIKDKHDFLNIYFLVFLTQIVWISIILNSYSWQLLLL